LRQCALTAVEKDAAPNLILLCPTCHTLVDKDKSGAFSVEWLRSIKVENERGGAFELNSKDAVHALAILSRSKMKTGNKVVTAGGNVAQAKADRSGVAVSIGGDNHGDVTIRTSSPKGVRGFKANSIGADANLSGYLDYLCERWVTYMAPTQDSPEALRGRIGKNLKDAFRLRKRTRNDLPAERFQAAVDFLLKKLTRTPIGKKHVSNGTKLCSTFEEWRTTTA
jgi:hypothetical protein